ncbi:hypothetical protein GCM10028857_08030 [Salinarchaeum chitinilyticum]
MSDASSEDQRASARGPSIDSFAALFEHAPQPLAVVRNAETPRVEVVNRAFLEQFDGRSAGQSERGSFDRRSSLSQAEREVARTAIGGTSTETVATKETTDGLRQFSVRGIPAPGADVDAYLQFRDVTTQRVRNQQLAVLRRILRHDLRNDLTVLLGYAETIAESSDDAKSREQAATMVEAASDLRNVATSAGRMQCVTDSATPTKLRDATTHVRRSVADAFSGEFHVDGPVPTVSIDRRTGIAVEEVCRTLADHSDVTTIRVDPSVTDDRVTISVNANGPLSEQERAALEGLDETKLRHATGISPWIARWAVRAAGGRLRVENDPTCRIQVTVPVVESAQSSTADD